MPKVGPENVKKMLLKSLKWLDQGVLKDGEIINIIY